MSSVLYRPIVDSAKALSYASPTDPTDASTPAAMSRSVNAIEVYCFGAGVGVVDQSSQVGEAAAVAGPDRHLQRVQDEAGAHGGVRPPPEDASGVGVE